MSQPKNQPSAKYIPQGYTFVDPWTMISKRASETLDNLLDSADARDPDLHGMYIYNDFYSYAIVDLVDKTLSTLHSKIAKKQWEDAYTLLEAMVIFLKGPGEVWPMIDDGDHTEETNRTYGACVVTILRGLKSQGKLSPATLPSLETVLREVTEWGDAISKLTEISSDYRFVTKAIGKRFFAEKTKADEELEKKMVDEWLESLEPDLNEQMKKRIKERKEEDEADDSWMDDPKFRARIIGKLVRKKDRKPWWFNTSTKDWQKRFDNDEDLDDEDFVMSKVWKKYKGFLKENPNEPELNEEYMPKRYCKWDLTKWSGRMKEPFLMSTGESDEEMD